MNIKQVIGYDIETAPHYDDKADPTKDKLRFVGFRLPSGQKVVYEYPQQAEAIQNTLHSYKYITGHNIEKRTYNGMEMGYDNEIMERYGFKFETRDGQKHIFFDTQKIAEKRCRAMMYIKLGQGQFNLKYLTEFFKVVDDRTRKGEFNYFLLRKPFLLPSERKDLIEYLHRDLDAQWNLFEYFWNNFSGIMPRLSKLNQLNGQWLNGASGTTGYRWYCNVTGLPELYDWETGYEEYTGALMDVLQNIDVAEFLLVFDFKSLYPSMMRGNGLYSRCPEEYVDKESLIDIRNGRPLWNGGNDVFPTCEHSPKNGIVGYYYHDEVGVFEKELEMMSLEKDKATELYKLTGDMTYHYERLGIKILMNSSYGASGSPAFSSMYDKITAEDITRSGQCCIRHARKIMEEHGYTIMYLHTDSLYVIDPYKDVEKLKKLAREITETQKKCLNIPTDMHSFEFEKKLEKMWLTKGDDGENLKQRNFILYKDKSGELKADFTGGKLANFNTSELSKKVWNDIISKDLINGKRDLYYEPEQLLRMVKSVGKENPDLLAIRKKSKNLTSYKTENSQQAKITKMYGVGEHFLIPNKYIGLGDSSGKKFLAKREELEKAFGLDWVSAVDYKKYLQELSVFVRPEKRKELRKIDV